MIYKIIRNIFILAFIFWIYSLLSVSTYAVGPILYYQDLFETFGIKTKIVNNIDKQLEKQKEGGEIKLSIETLLRDDDVEESNFLLLFSSQANLIDLVNNNPFNKIIIICNSQYELANGNSCNTNNISKNHENSRLLKLGEYKWYKDDISLLQEEIANKNIYLIPQQILLTPEFTKDAGIFFGNLNSSLEALTKYHTGVSKQLIEHLNPILLSGIIYIFVTAIFLSLCWKFIQLNTLRSLSQALTLKFLKNTTQKLALELSRYRKSLILIILTGLYVPIVSVASAKLLPHILPQSASFLLLSNIMTTLGAKLELVTIAISGLYLIIMTTLIILFLIPTIIRLTIDLNTKTKSLKIKHSTSKHVLIVLLFLSIISTFSYIKPINQNYLITSTLLITSVYFYYALTKNPSKQLLFYTRREKIAYTMILLTLISFIILFSLQIIHVGQRYQYEKLLNNETRIIPLPYYKDFDSDKLFETFYFDENFPLFVNEYMIYHPDFKHINLVPLKDFSINNKNFYVILKNDYSLLQDAINTQGLDEFITSEQSSKYFYFNNAKFNINKQYILNITINCSKSSVQPAYVSIAYKNDLQMENFNTTTLLNFPGCIKGENVSFSVPIDTKHLKNKVLYKIDQPNEKYIEEFSFTENEVELEKKNIIKIDENKLYIVKEVKTTAEDTITVYLPTFRENQKSIRFDILSEKKDISAHINTLIQLGKLKDRFIIWSNIENSTIQRQIK